MSDINWSEKPEWADVWLESFSSYANSGWRKDSGNYWVSDDHHYWTKDHEVDGYYKIHYPPKTKPEWNGEGLPPVGVVCELSNCGQDYYEAEILFMGSVYCIVKHEHNSEQHYYLSSLKFRPIKPDKEKWIEKAVNIYFSRISCDKLDRFGVLYDALISGELPIPRGDKL